MWFRVPETVKIVLKNRLPEGVFAKDLALWIKGILSKLDVNGLAIEYHGEGVASLSIDDRMTIANISTEMGVVSSAFPPDDRLADYFNEPAVRGVWADEEAVYSRFIEIDLANVFPMVYDTGNNVLQGVEELVGLKIQQGLIGACASGRLEDLRLVSMILEGNILLTGSNYSWFRLPGIYIYGRLKRVLLIRSHSRGRWFSAPVADLAWEWDAWRLSGIAVLSLPPIASTSGGRITPVLRNISLPRQPWPDCFARGIDPDDSFRGNAV